MDEKRAYEILEIEEGSDRDAIEERYGFLVKRIKNGGSYEYSEEELIDAYLFLTDRDKYDLKKAEAEGNVEELERLKPKGRFGAWLEYYKVQIILAVIFVGFFGYIAFTFFTNTKPDITVAFVQPATHKVSTKLERKILDLDKDIKEVTLIPIVDTSYIQMKMTTGLAAGEVDVYVMNEFWLREYVTSGAFEELSKYIDDDANLDKDRLYEAKPKDATSKGIYAVRVTESEMLDDVDCGYKTTDITEKEDMYILIARKSKHLEAAEKFFDAVVDQLPD